MSPFIHGDWSGESYPTPRIGDVEPNRTIDAELAYCVPASDPECPTCEQPMNLLPGQMWACGNDDCPDRDVYDWIDGALVRVADLL